MNPVSVAVLLTAVVVAQADQMSDVLHMPPHEQYSYIFDVTYEASVDDLKAALGNFSIEDAYKLIGEIRYLFLVSSKDTASLHSLTFPAGSAVTQHPVENMNKYFKMFGAGGVFQDNYTDTKSLDTVLFFLDYYQNWPETVCSKAQEMMMMNFAKKSKTFYDLTKPKIYASVASHPPRWLEFHKLEDNAMQKFARLGVAVFGGTGEALETAKRLVRM